MVGLVIVSHGDFSTGILDAMIMICGDQKQIGILSLIESESPDDLKKKIEESLRLVDSGDGVLILVDLFGATPFNVAMRYYLESENRIEIVTGVNLPMLLEVVLNREKNDVTQILEIAIKAGREGINTIPEAIRK